MVRGLAGPSYRRGSQASQPAVKRKGRGEENGNGWGERLGPWGAHS